LADVGADMVDFLLVRVVSYRQTIGCIAAEGRVQCRNFAYVSVFVIHRLFGGDGERFAVMGDSVKVRS
jgi:hypothetical protein